MASKKQRQRRKIIKAEAVIKDLISIVADGVEVIAAADDKGVPKFSMQAYSGGPLKLKGIPLPVIVDLAGLSYADSIVANLDHDETRRVGHVTEKSNDGKSLRLEGIVSAATDASREVVESASADFPWQASIEAKILEPLEQIKAGKLVNVNGQAFQGPVYVARKTKLFGVALLTRGADDSTTVKIAAAATKEIEMDKELKDWIIAKTSFDPETLDEKQIEWLQSQYDAEIKAAKNVKPKTDEEKSIAELLEDAKQKAARTKEITEITAAAITDYPSSIEAIKAIAELAIDGDWDKQRYELEILRLTRPQASAIVAQRKDPKLNNRVIEAAICEYGNLPDLDEAFNDETLQASHDRFPHGIGLQQIILMAARDNGYDDRYASQVNLEIQRAAFRMQGQGEIKAAGFSTINLPNILSNTANKFLGQGFNAVDGAWRALASRKSVRDFKQITTESLTGDWTYELVGADGELKHGTAGELRYTNQADTYGRMFAITRTDIINDDLDALTAVPRKLGRGAGLKLNNIFWTEFLNNTGSHFTSGNSNVSTGAGSALDASGGGIDAAEVVFMNQTDPDGEPLGIMPAILLVPPTLKNIAQRLMRSSGSTGGNTTHEVDINIYEGRYTVVSSPYMENTNYTGNSTAVWYLLASPGELSTIEICFLNGRETPTIDSADADFNVLGIQMRGYVDAGVSLQEVRAGVRSAGS